MTFFTEKSAKIQNQNSQNFNTRLRRGKQAKKFFQLIIVSCLKTKNSREKT